MTIKIYSTPSCTYCHAAKELFKEKNVEFTEVDVAANIEERKKMIEISGQMGVPVIEINNQVIVGFDQNLLEKMIAEGSGAAGGK
ncbi:MAG: Uxx-star family glutaredoxin-like (seleno)protein [bacterium]